MAKLDLPAQSPSWGTAARADAEGMRRTRGLGLGAAVRRYNDLAVPGIGGLWFAKPLVWSMIGLTLGGKGATRAEVANAVEVVAMLHALLTNRGGRNPRINGSAKLGRQGNSFPPFAVARQRRFYVTVPLRQGMIQPLRELGLAQSYIQRFNSFEPSEVGKDFLSAALEPFRPHRQEVQKVVKRWIDGEAGLMHTAEVRDALTPLTGLPKPAAELLREQLFGGAQARPRRRVRDWLRAVKASGEVVSWSSPPEGFDAEHWNDLRDGARFFLVRDRALDVLDAIEAQLRSSGSTEIRLDAAVKAAASALEQLRRTSKEFLSGNPVERADALNFAVATSQADDARVLTFLAERDGRGVRATPNGVATGSAFDPHGPLSQAPVDEGTVRLSEDDDAPAPEAKGLQLPPGASGRLRALVSLDQDIEDACGTVGTNRGVLS